jgi:hypothetical protein
VLVAAVEEQVALGPAIRTDDRRGVDVAALSVAKTKYYLTTNDAATHEVTTGRETGWRQ